MATQQQLQALNVSYNNFSGQLPPAFAGSRFTADSFLGNDPSLCGPPLRQCVTASGLSSRGVAGMVIGLMGEASGRVVAKQRREKGRRGERRVVGPTGGKIVFSHDS